jgi:hypothetical protein
MERPNKFDSYVEKGLIRRVAFVERGLIRRVDLC